MIACGIYPAILWGIGQTLWPFQVNGSILTGPDGKAVGSLLIAQPFTKAEYFWRRSSAANYDGTASASSALAVSNYALRNRVATQVGPIVTYSAAPHIRDPAGEDRHRHSEHLPLICGGRNIRTRSWRTFPGLCHRIRVRSGS